MQKAETPPSLSSAGPAGPHSRTAAFCASMFRSLANSHRGLSGTNSKPARAAGQ
jgi:hypothetical protein